ncbi:hypothetical protein GRAN_3796 [Granulicella sibirica]|uniref:Uncharacterized protein n=1 Tax=Granulicella sibirica TaxID=2479048 RepID=A0A4Q0SW88_9BACT|nr:hypothetical protein GRAN_3796 [Granulicella sibirica]
MMDRSGIVLCIAHSFFTWMASPGEHIGRMGGNVQLAH